MLDVVKVAREAEMILHSRQAAHASQTGRVCMRRNQAECRLIVAGGCPEVAEVGRSHRGDST